MNYKDKRKEAPRFGVQFGLFQVSLFILINFPQNVFYFSKCCANPICWHASFRALMNKRPSRFAAFPKKWPIASSLWLNSLFVFILQVPPEQQLFSGTLPAICFMDINSNCLALFCLFLLLLCLTTTSSKIAPGKMYSRGVRDQTFKKNKRLLKHNSQCTTI